MRILMLLSQTEITGAEVHAVQLGEELQEQGHQVFLISDTLNVKTNLNYTALALHPRGFIRRLKNIYFLHRFILSHRIDVIHAHSRAAVRVAFWCRWRTKCALVSTIHGRQHFSWSKRLFNIYGQHLIAICGNVKRHLIEDFGISSNCIANIGNPIRDSKLSFQNELNSECRWAVVGRTSGPKGEKTSFLIQNVFPMLLKDFPKLSIDLLGGPIETLGAKTLARIEQLKRDFPGRFNHPTSTDLDQAMGQYQMIFGAGRVAITALTRGIPVWALGEARSEGLIEPNNFSELQKSNFGDIGPHASPQTLNAEELIFELRNLLLNPPLDQTLRYELRRLSIESFGALTVTARILNIYKSAILLSRQPRFIPVLMYHMVTETPIQTPHRIFVTVETFSYQLSVLKKRGFSTITFGDLEAFTEGRRPWTEFPLKPIILTFDDGYQNNLIHALPVLKKFNFRAVIYLLANHDLRANDWDRGEMPLQPLLDPKERMALAESGYFEIGSHGLEHRRLSEFCDEDIAKLLLQSKQFLEDEFKAPVLSYAFTYGVRKDDWAERALQTGYKYVLNTDQGGFHLAVPTSSIFRIPIFPKDKGLKFWRKLQPWYRNYFYWTRKK